MRAGRLLTLALAAAAAVSAVSGASCRTPTRNPAPAPSPSSAGSQVGSDETPAPSSASPVTLAPSTTPSTTTKAPSTPPATTTKAPSTSPTTSAPSTPSVTPAPSATVAPSESPAPSTPSAPSTSTDGILLSTYTGTDGLDDLASAAGKYMGTATDQFATDAEYRKTLENAADWGWLTPGNVMKWDATEPSQNSFQFARADAFLEEAKKIDAKVRCHTLLWHSQVPQWVQNLGKDELLAALKNHVTKVMTHFGDACVHWDVLNEALADDGSYRNSFWYQKTGTEYIKVAFETASAVKKQLGLRTKLYYNDYNTDHVNAKSTAALNKIVKFLQDQDIEINGMGLQAHLIVGQVRSKADQIANMKRFTDLGLEVAITELDIRFQTAFPAPQPIKPTEAQQKQQVTDYENTIAACKDLEGCVGVTIWDFSDQWSWIPNDLPLPMYQPGGRGTKVVRKAAYDGIVRGWGGSA